MRRALAPALLAVALTLPSAPRAFTIEGKAWTQRTIKVWNSTSYRIAVADAMRSWNASGARIRFTAAPSRAEGDVIVRTGPPGDEGRAVVGFPADGGPSTVLLARGLARVTAAALAAHELGHVLGLGHVSGRCSVMAAVVTVGNATRCRIGACAMLWRCLVQPDDRAGAIRLYGRTAPR